MSDELEFYNIMRRFEGKRLRAVRMTADACLVLEFEDGGSIVFEDVPVAIIYKYGRPDAPTVVYDGHITVILEESRA